MRRAESDRARWQTSTTTARQRSKAGFDLTPPSPEQLRALVADLDDEERRVLLEHGTERPFCGIFNEAKEQGHLLLPPLRAAPVQCGHQVRIRHRLAELLRPHRPRSCRLRARHQLRHGAHRDPLRPLRGPSRPRLQRRPAADRRALLHELGLHALRRRGRSAAGRAGTRRAGGRGGWAEAAPWTAEPTARPETGSRDGSGLSTPACRSSIISPS